MAVFSDESIPKDLLVDLIELFHPILPRLEMPKLMLLLFES